MVSDEDKRKFESQRRNLMITSIILAFLINEELIIKELNFLGNKFQLSHPDGLKFYVWILWGYFFVRYFQFIPERLFIHIKGMFQQHFESNYPNILINKFNKKIEEFNEFISEKLLFAVKNNGYKLKFDFRGNPKFKHELFRFLIYDLNLIISATKKGESISNNPTKLFASFKGTELAIPYLRSMIYLLVRKSVFTDYFLPFMVGLLPIYAYIF